MTLKDWYWVILVIAILFAGLGAWRDDVWIGRVGNIVLIVLLVLIGFLLPGGGPIK